MLFKYHEQEQQSTGEVKLLSHGSVVLSSQCPVHTVVVVFELCLLILGAHGEDKQAPVSSRGSLVCQ